MPGIPHHVTQRGNRRKETYIRDEANAEYKSQMAEVSRARGLDRFRRRGESACASEWAEMCATHNLLKLYRSGRIRQAHRAGDTLLQGVPKSRGKANWN